MGEIIPFPTVRHQDHIALRWDSAWDRYSVEVQRRSGLPPAMGWHESHADAMEQAFALSEGLGLPIVDLTIGRQA